MKYAALLAAVLITSIDMPRFSVARVDSSSRIAVETEALAVPSVTFTMPSVVHHHVMLFKLLLHIVPEAYKRRVRNGPVLIIGSGLENSLLGDQLRKEGMRVAGLSALLNVIDNWWVVGHYTDMPFSNYTFAIVAGLDFVQNLKKRWHPNKQDRLVYWNMIVSEVSRVLWKGGFFMVDAEEGEEFDIILRHNNFVRLTYAAFDGRAIYQNVTRIHHAEEELRHPKGLPLPVVPKQIMMRSA
jgi:hypothetical protein